MDYLPIFLDLREAPCLVVGGGTVGARRANLLCEAGARVTVVSPALGPELTEVLGLGQICHRSGPYRADDLVGMRLAVAATDSGQVNRQVSHDARALGVPVNVVDTPALCSFIMPAIVDRAPVTVAVSTGGASPVLARLTRGRLEAALPPDYGRLAELARRYRGVVKERVADPNGRRRLWERALSGRVAALVLAGRQDEAERELEDLIVGQGSQAMTLLSVVLAADGDVQQLSLRASARLGGADLVVHPRRGLEGVVALARRDASRVPVAGEGAVAVIACAAEQLRAHPGLGSVCVVIGGIAGAELAEPLADLASLGELELLHPAPR